MRVGIARTIGWLVLWTSVACCPVFAQQQVECASCHDQAKKISGSVHSDLGCATCHDQHEKYPHQAGIAKPVCADCHEKQAMADARGVHGLARANGNAGAPDCGVCHGDIHQIQSPSSAAFRKAVPETCGMCHDEVVQQFLTSVHGKALEAGVRNAPLCTDCHGEHSIVAHTQQSSPVHASHIRETCARCHGDVRLSQKFGFPADRIVSFDASYHGMAAKAGSVSVANCASCHGFHNILPSSDPKSTINPKNLPATCGQCHPGAGKRFAIGSVHWTESGDPPTGVRWVRSLYLFLIPSVIGLMVLHNLGDWVRKLSHLRLRARILPAHRTNPGVHWSPEVRMHRFERIQHAILVVSFSVLVWTGFALKYPGQWWAHPLLLWESVFPVRATVHRIAAVVMMAVAAMHAASLFTDRRLRQHWRELWPRAGDMTEAIQGLAYRLGLITRKPVQSSHSYVEKAEYWAVVWGTAVMIVTGVMLWATRFMLTWLPKSWLDIATSIHFYEAVLATLAIVVWHLYSVVFDPEVYPMDTAWLTGLSVRKHGSHQPHEPARDTSVSHSS